MKRLFNTQPLFTTLRPSAGALLALGLAVGGVAYAQDKGAQDKAAQEKGVQQESAKQRAQPKCPAEGQEKRLIRIGAELSPKCKLSDAEGEAVELGDVIDDDADELTVIHVLETRHLERRVLVDEQEWSDEEQQAVLASCLKQLQRAKEGLARRATQSERADDAEVQWVVIGVGQSVNEAFADEAEEFFEEQGFDDVTLLLDRDYFLMDHGLESPCHLILEGRTLRFMECAKQPEGRNPALTRSGLGNALIRLAEGRELLHPKGADCRCESKGAASE